MKTFKTRLVSTAVGMVAALLLSACGDVVADACLPDGEGMDNGDGTVTLTFGIEMPVPSAATTRAMTEDVTDSCRWHIGQNLYVLVFDRGGVFCDYGRAFNIENHDDGTTRFAVRLKATTERRIVHFLANYDASEWLATATAGMGTERTMLNHRSVSAESRVTVGGIEAEAPDTYWHRTEVDGIGVDTRFRRIPLVRNFAMVSVENSSTDNFNFTGCAIINRPNEGTLVAYAENIGQYIDYWVPDSGSAPGQTPTGKDYATLNGERFYGFAPRQRTFSNSDEGLSESTFAFHPALTFTTESQFVYETPNANTKDVRGKTYMIVRGDYTDGDGYTYTDRYYKVDFVYYGSEGTQFYDILRNIHYRLSIKSVLSAGYDTPEEAARHTAANNISYDVNTMNVNEIGDGRQRIFVSGTYFCYTSGYVADSCQPKTQLRFKYFGLDGAWFNDAVSIKASGDVDDMFGVETVHASGVAIAAEDSADNWRQVSLVLSEPQLEPKRATLLVYVDRARIKATADSLVAAGLMTQAEADAMVARYDDELLQREVTVVLRQRYPMALECHAAPIGETGITIDLLLPQAIDWQMFPLTFLIEPEQKTICPDALQNVLPVQLGPSITGTGQPAFQYRKVLTREEYEGYTETTVHDGTTFLKVPLHFRASTPDPETWVYAKSADGYFIDARDLLSPAAQP